MQTATKRLTGVIEWTLLVAVVLLASGVFAPAVSADSKHLIMIVEEPREDGINDPNLGPLIRDRLVSLLGAKYRCADPMTLATYRGLADWIRAHEAQMTDEERRQGSKYVTRDELNDWPWVVVETAIGKTGNSYYVKVEVKDLESKTLIAGQSKSGEGDGKTLLGLIERVVDELEIPAARCPWRGAITVTTTSEWSSESSEPKAGNVVVTRNARTDVRRRANSTDEISILLNDSRQSRDGEVTALVTRRFNGYSERMERQTGEVDCARGWTAAAFGLSDYHFWSFSSQQTNSSSGQTAEKGGLSIVIDSGGHYQLTMSVPSVRVMNRYFSAKQSFPEVCGSVQESSTYQEWKDATLERTISAEGDIDPRNPNVITGSKTTNEASSWSEFGTATTTTTWHLQRPDG